MAAAAVGRIRCAVDQSVTLHACQHLRHRGLLGPDEPGQVPLRPVLKRHQHRQVPTPKPNGLRRASLKGANPRAARLIR